MRKIVIILIALLSVMILGLCVLLGLGLSGRLSLGRVDLRRGGAYRLVQEKEFPAAEIESIRVEYTKNGNDVAVYLAEGDSVIVREYANYEAAESDLAQMRQQGGKLTVKGPRQNTFFLFSFHFSINSYNYTEIYLPAEYAGSLDISTVSGDIDVERDLLLEGELVLSSTSGNIDADTRNMKAKNCRIESVSGDVSLSAIEAGTADISTTSGDIRVEKADARTSLSCSSISGEIKIYTLKTDEADVSSTSGDIWIESAEAAATCSTTSGNISILSGTGARKLSSSSGDIWVDGLSGDVSVDTISGDVRLGLPADFSAEFEAGTTSGDIDTFFDEDLSYSKKGNHAQGTMGGGMYKIRLGTTSGDIRVVNGR